MVEPNGSASAGILKSAASVCEREQTFLVDTAWLLRVLVWSVKAREPTLVVVERRYTYGEFDPGSGRTLATCLRNASRADWKVEDGGWRVGEEVMDR